MIKRFDGVVVGSGLEDLGDRRMFRTFDPPWWRVDRWFGWYAKIARERIVNAWLAARGLQVHAFKGRGMIFIRHLGKRRHGVRIEEIDHMLPNVPGPDAVEIVGGPPREYYH